MPNISHEHDNKNDETPLLSVIVVSYNTRETTLECLRRVVATTQNISSEIWVVDNASSDGSCDAIRREFPHVHIIENRENVGFGAANNQAMNRARGEWFLLLNSDAFVHDGAIETLIEYSKAHPQVGVSGPRLCNSDGSLQRSCFRFPTPRQAWMDNLWISRWLAPTSRWGNLRRWPHDRELCVDWIVGACLLVRREVWQQIGGFDERFLMYSEETDWQRGAARRGWKIAFVPRATVTHWGGTSGANSPHAHERTRMNESFFQSLDFYQWKHHGWAGLISLRAAMTIGGLMRTVAWTLASAIPAQRRIGRTKSKFHAWLVVRQLTRWKLPFKSRSSTR